MQSFEVIDYLEDYPFFWTRTAFCFLKKGNKNLGSATWGNWEPKFEGISLDWELGLLHL